MFQSPPGPKAECNNRGSALPFPPLPFQSPPGPKAECNFSPTTRRSNKTCFNPHPARRPSATSGPLAFPQPARVSIPTRPEGRVQRKPDAAYSCRSACFNPHPARRPSATLVAGDVPYHAAIVSIPTRPEGRVQRLCLQRVIFGVGVSIPTRPEGRVQHHLDHRRIKAPHVSIPTRPEGRVQPPAPRH